MINQVIDGVCRAINNEFGEEYHIYTEKIEQRFTRPCFFVKTEQSSTELFRGDRYFMKNKVLVTYYPCYKGKNQDMGEILQRLSLSLEVINVEAEPLRCTALSTSLSGDKAEAQAEYNFFVRLKKEEEKPELMEEHTLNFTEGEE